GERQVVGGAPDHLDAALADLNGILQAVEADIGLGGHHRKGIDVDRQDLTRAEASGGQGEDAGAGADVQDAAVGPDRPPPGRRGAETDAAGAGWKRASRSASASRVVVCSPVPKTPPDAGVFGNRSSSITRSPAAAARRVPRGPIRSDAPMRIG